MKKTAAAYLGLIIVFVLWGSLYVVSSVVLQYMPTFAVMFCRFAIAFAALSVIVKIDSRKWNPDGTDSQGRKTRIDRQGWKYVILMGVLGYAIGVGIQLMGTRYAGSSMASLINSLNPVAISLMAVPILHEKLTGNKMAGILLAVFGVYLILGTGGNINIPGIILSLVSVLLWSFVSVLTRICPAFCLPSDRNSRSRRRIRSDGHHFMYQFFSGYMVSRSFRPEDVRKTFSRKLLIASGLIADSSALTRKSASSMI